MAVEPTTVISAYSVTGSAWESGPNRIYDRLAEALVAQSPVPLAGRRVLDLGAGTGAASRAIVAAGGRPLALDAAPGMLGVDARSRPPAVAGDAAALPFRSRTFDAVVAAFSLNHLEDPRVGFGEAARVTQPGGVVLASAYAEDDDHAVKAATRTALREAGWSPPPWLAPLQAGPVLALATRERALAAAQAAGLDADAARSEIAFPELGPNDLVRWRLGMADAAWFVSSLDAASRAAIERRAVELLGDNPPVLVRRVVFVTAIVAGGPPA